MYYPQIRGHYCTERERMGGEAAVYKRFCGKFWDNIFYMSQSLYSS
jgi:hypothetical protein